MRKIFAAAALLAIQCAGAVAADLPPAPTAYKSPAVVPPIYNWTGLYVGVNAGYGSGTQDPLGLFSDDFARFSYSMSGAMAGGTAGAQIQSGHVVLGLEGDIDWTNLKGAGTGSVTKLGVFQGTATIASNITMIDTLRARVGYAQDNWLFYGTVGVAMANGSAAFNQTVGFACNSPTFLVAACTSKSEWHPGLAAGGGLEYGFTPNISAKLEYLWVGAGAVNTLSENMVRGGVNFRFGGQ